MAQRIEVVRGTTNTFQISITDSGGGAYNLGSGEKVVFGVKRKPTDTDCLIEKTAEILGAGLFQVVISPTDTEELSFGKYWYDVGLQKGEDFFNVIEPNPFEIMPNITSREV